MPRTHATLPRLFVAADLVQGGQMTLGKEQSLYLAAVLRKAVGDEAVLFNGRDGAWRCRLTSDAKKAVALEMLEQIAPQTPPSSLWYGFAPLRSERLDYVIQKATEMGVGIIQPVMTSRTQVSRVKPEKLLANAIEAAEQCEVLSVPEIAPEIGFERLLAEWPAERALVFADEGADSASPLAALSALRGREIGLLVGPEGGFDESERARLHAHPQITAISLGPRILRADTAAVAALAVIQATIGDWR